MEVVLLAHQCIRTHFHERCIVHQIEYISNHVILRSYSSVIIDYFGSHLLELILFSLVVNAKGADHDQ